jgi:hypothetical protein
MTRQESRTYKKSESTKEKEFMTLHRSENN